MSNSALYRATRDVTNPGGRREFGAFRQATFVPLLPSNARIILYQRLESLLTAQHIPEFRWFTSQPNPGGSAQRCEAPRAFALPAAFPPGPRTEPAKHHAPRAKTAGESTTTGLHRARGPPPCAGRLSPGRALERGGFGDSAPGLARYADRAAWRVLAGAVAGPFVDVIRSPGNCVAGHRSSASCQRWIRTGQSTCQYVSGSEALVGGTAGVGHGDGSDGGPVTAVRQGQWTGLPAWPGHMIKVPPSPPLLTCCCDTDSGGNVTAPRGDGFRGTRSSRQSFRLDAHGPWGPVAESADSQRSNLCDSMASVTSRSRLWRQGNLWSQHNAIRQVWPTRSGALPSSHFSLRRPPITCAHSICNVCGAARPERNGNLNKDRRSERTDPPNQKILLSLTDSTVSADESAPDVLLQVRGWAVVDGR